ncbi:MAG: DNA-binding LytR/AlgR family response regulator, partial [Paracoccaceae bacterium]
RDQATSKRRLITPSPTFGHNSHWVALAAIDRVEKSGTSLKVLMKDGSQVPVSRSFRTAIKDAGLL